jgi:HlyD family secretion protein
MASSGDQVTNFSVKIRILRSSYTDLLDASNPHLSPFRPGMSATVEILTHTEQNVLSVPIMAVTTRSAVDAKATEADAPLDEVVFVYKNGKVKMQKVKTGIQDMNYIRIIEGLKPNDEIVSGPYSAISKTLKDSMEVQVVDASELYNAQNQ